MRRSFLDYSAQNISVMLIIVVVLFAFIFYFFGNTDRRESNQSEAPAPSPSSGPGMVLVPLTELPTTPSVWVYGDAAPGSANCTEIVPDMVPATQMGLVDAKVVSCGGDGVNRLRFARDSAGKLYLTGVELLVPVKELPPRREGRWRCEDIADLLIPASDSVPESALGVVCDVEPLSRSPVPNPRVIWAQIVRELAPPVLPEGARCSSLTRYLGSGGERATINVRCVLG